ncbi:DNA primase [Novosphingobium resinovorum]|uniref:DNA primase n=1 Tax=Novosphingobium resinovorum TaxID=158500 RepID=A0A031JRC8_9SPHN|nr:CHC2 zinc finger domain-containing protein [Novosphingobium resinovorum]EZP79510.1 DNA primase [Novosphingobium resinovorum]
MIDFNPAPRGRFDTDALRRNHSVVDQAKAAGIKLERAGDELKACCPFHNDRSPSMTIYRGGSRWYCFGCGKGGDVVDFLRELHKVDFKTAAAMLAERNAPAVALAPIDHTPSKAKEERIEDARAIWRNAVPALGTPAETYLRSRGLDLAIPETIRFARLSYGNHGPLHPCLVAVITGPDNRLAGVQRTYLADGGLGKANVRKPKLSLGRISGGAIRLAPAAYDLMVCEGLEDGLTLQQQHGIAVWVAAGAGNMPKMRFPSIVGRIAVGGDADDAGRTSADTAVSAFRSLGIISRSFFPTSGKDFNAELMGRASA